MSYPCSLRIYVYQHVKTLVSMRAFLSMDKHTYKSEWWAWY